MHVAIKLGDKRRQIHTPAGDSSRIYYNEGYKKKQPTVEIHTARTGRITAPLARSVVYTRNVNSVPLLSRSCPIYMQITVGLRTATLHHRKVTVYI